MPISAAPLKSYYILVCVLVEVIATDILLLKYDDRFKFPSSVFTEKTSMMLVFIPLAQPKFW